MWPTFVAPGEANARGRARAKQSDRAHPGREAEPPRDVSNGPSVTGSRSAAPKCPTRGTTPADEARRLRGHASAAQKCPDTRYDGLSRCAALQPATSRFDTMKVMVELSLYLLEPLGLIRQVPLAFVSQS